MSWDDTDHLPYLPPELERLIFEVACIRHGSRCSTKYLLVARRVNTWLKPLIFRVFNQMTLSIFPDFERYPDTLKLEELGKFAQRLILKSGSEKGLKKMLSHFPSLQDFALWVQPIKFLLPTLDNLPLKRLSADLSDLAHDDYLSSTFSNITHLDVIKFHGRTWKEWEVLSKLPHLTHLIIGSLIDLDVFPNLLHHVSQLRILIFMPGEQGIAAWMGENEHKLNVNDDRLVMLSSPRFPILLEDWVKGGESGLDCWAFCELISVARRRKLFLDNPPKWFERIFNWDKHLTDEGKKWYSELNWQDAWFCEFMAGTTQE
ncbi:hypothetical protein M413DRAFT_442289 [Hebeloma cylindrosporum]|uniref:Uncharacterized protein n=1 Tax=Hebeloma cylindrosporum TaxID=76867 RepID=A0A0C2YXG2_HEBCY|nr:hypothetical protein M413DRAFT_442289 [Hebeloma cylindrosporum h7]